MHIGGAGTITPGSTAKLVVTADQAPLHDTQITVTLAGDAAQRARLASSAAAYAAEHFWTWDQRMAAELEAVQALADAAHPLRATR